MRWPPSNPQPIIPTDAVIWRTGWKLSVLPVPLSLRLVPVGELEIMVRLIKEDIFNIIEFEKNKTPRQVFIINKALIQTQELAK